MLSTGACENSLWTTGQNLRNNPALRSQLEPGGPLLVNGLQGNPVDSVRPANAPPTVSYFVDYDDKFDDPRATGHLPKEEKSRELPSIKLPGLSPGGPSRDTGKPGTR